MSNFQTLLPMTQGVPGTAPRVYSAVTTDALSVITTAGYLNDITKLVKANDFFFVNYLDTSIQPPGENSTFGLFQVVYSNPNYNLVAYNTSAAGALLAVNNLSDVASPATSRTNLGLGTAAQKTASDNTLANVASVAATVVNGNVPNFSNTSGALGDSGILGTNLQLKSNIHAAVSGNISAVTLPLSTAVTVAGLTTGSVVIPQIVSSTTACTIQAVTVGTGSFTVTTSVAPGTSLIISYVAFIAPQ